MATSTKLNPAVRERAIELAKLEAKVLDGLNRLPADYRNKPEILALLETLGGRR